MLSKEYLYTARTLRRIALNMTDEKIADRLESLAKQYERRSQKGLCFGFGQCLSPARCSRRTPGVACQIKRPRGSHYADLPPVVG